MGKEESGPALVRPTAPPSQSRETTSALSVMTLVRAAAALCRDRPERLTRGSALLITPSSLEGGERSRCSGLGRRVGGSCAPGTAAPRYGYVQRSDRVLGPWSRRLARPGRRVCHRLRGRPPDPAPRSLDRPARELASVPAVRQARPNRAAPVQVVRLRLRECRPAGLRVRSARQFCKPLRPGGTVTLR